MTPKVKIIKRTLNKKIQEYNRIKRVIKFSRLQKRENNLDRNDDKIHFEVQNR
ncbi:hypothetical protein LEP1GSC049_2191 [Leptospira kirschneri serovar Cynopteri str. 3522 CT]|nr:hypothetical protein LEP1GSC042_0547 [Leptospira kirschneri serovar Bim str. PUO 1247]EMN04540.1 hypothetical protein LEP1GSC046_4024 [Leptospira kirschneri serovar Bim str. 1051]EMN25575.1 hypothetical protein LEP1GSC065_3842 [Leptospira kirschneri serovar Sokoine str. RM1]EPG51129.1 hypothetical protein LEP1GSC049_2191 [Leptospira kirschneri serovar Cynopteri str. 3522 CT]